MDLLYATGRSSPGGRRFLRRGRFSSAWSSSTSVRASLSTFRTVSSSSARFRPSTLRGTSWSTSPALGLVTSAASEGSSTAARLREAFAAFVSWGLRARLVGGGGAGEGDLSDSTSVSSRRDGLFVACGGSLGFAIRCFFRPVGRRKAASGISKDDSSGSSARCLPMVAFSDLVFATTDVEGFPPLVRGGRGPSRSSGKTIVIMFVAHI